MVPFKPKLISQLFSRFEVRNGSVRDCGDMGLLLVLSRHLSALMSHFFPVREMPPHTTTLPPPPKVLTQSVLQSTYRSLHLLRTFTLWSNCCSKNMDSSLNVTFLHMFKFQCTWAQKGLMVNHSLLGRLVGSPVRLEIGCMHSAWVESCRPYHLANRDFKSVEACIEFLRKSGVLVVLSSWDAHFVAYLWNPPLYGNRNSIWKRC